MIGIISAVVGLLTSAIPSLVKILEKRQESGHEIKLMEMRIEAASKGVDIQRYIEDTKADIKKENLFDSMMLLLLVMAGYSHYELLLDLF